MNLLNQIKEKVRKAFIDCGLSAENTLVRLSDRPDISDYQSNGALPLAKSMRQNPRALAEQIAEKLRLDPFFETVSVDGPGFINMKIANEVLGKNLFPILADKKCGYRYK